MLNTKIKSQIDKIWDSLWSGGIANPLTCMEQISYFIFMRRISEQDEQARQKAEFSGEDHQSVFQGHDDCRWDHFRHLEGDEMLNHERDVVFPWLKEELGQGDNLFARSMKDAAFMIPKGSLMVEMVNRIDAIYTEIDKEVAQGQQFQDVQGDMYEHFLGAIASAGKNGQFRTPRHIIQMMATIADPKLGENICDPACGTGGFLIAAYEHILSGNTSNEYCTTDRNGFRRGTIGDKLTDERQWEVLKNHTIFGYDFDSTMIRIGAMNLMLHGLDSPNIDRKDTLSKNYSEASRYDVILANPPFKGSIDKGDINESLSLPTTKTELLFVNQMINIMKTGGRTAVIVPDGVLFGSSRAHKQLRKMVIEDCELQAIISMPSGVFKPYAGVSTGIMYFVKGGTTENVWFYDMEADGYTLDDKRDETDDNDIPDLLEKWEERDSNKESDRTSKSFFVPVSEIKENDYDLSINRYKEIVYEPIEYDPPLEIIKKMKEMESGILKDLEELEAMLKK